MPTSYDIEMTALLDEDYSHMSDDALAEAVSARSSHRRACHEEHGKAARRHSTALTEQGKRDRRARAGQREANQAANLADAVRVLAGGS